MSSEISPLVEDPSLDFIIPTHNDYSNFTNILFIDQTIDQFQTFVDSANQDTLPIVYSRFSDVTTLNTFLTSNFSHIQRLCFAFHGFSSDSTDTPSQSLFQDDLFFHDSDLLAGATSFSPNVSFIKNLISQYNVQNIDYLGCNLLNFSNWKSYFELIDSFSSVIVGASDDETGNLKYGGDWILENTNENVKLVYFSSEIDTFTGLLATYVTESFPESGINVTYTYTLSGTESTITGFSPTGIANLEIPSTFVVSSSNYTIVTIFEHVFSSKGLTGTLTLPTYATFYGFNPFGHNPGLTGTLTIPSSVTYLGSNSFQYCSGLTELVILPGLTSIENNCFRYCGFTSVTLPNTIERINIDAFKNTSSLTEITIPDSVTWMNNNGVFGGSGLTTVIMNPTTNGLGITVPSSNVSFYGVTGVDIIAPPPPTYIVESFTGSGINVTYTYDISGNDTKITAFDPTSYAGALVITDVIIDDTSTSFTVNSIDANVFIGVTLLTSVTIPASVTNIGASAFSGATSLADITIAGSTIPTYAVDSFSNINPTFNVSFNDLKYMKGVSTNSVVGNNSAMTTIPTISETVPMFDTTNVTEFGANAFKDYTSLGAVAIPSFITSIGSAAFSGATSLADITIAGSTVPTYAADSFSNINPTFNVTFDNMKYIKDASANISVVGNDISMIGATPTILETIPFFDTTNVTNIGANAFKDYLGITSTIIPESITSIGASAFSGATSLDSVTIPESMLSIGASAFSGDIALTSITIPVGVTSIGANAFLGATSLTTVKIPYPNGLNMASPASNVDVYGEIANVVFPGTAPAAPTGVVGWGQVGLDIVHGDGYDTGWSVSMNSDGSIIAIGAIYTTDVNNSGTTRIYQDVSGTWTQLGNTITGEFTNDQSGETVSLNNNGTIVAIGSRWHNSSRGHVRVFQYNGINNSWVQIGTEIQGTIGGAYSMIGYLNGNGNILAVGSMGGIGNVRIYENISGTWTQLGGLIEGENSNDNSGLDISLSDDGTIVAIGARGNDGNGNYSGHVRVYQYDVNKTTNVTDQNSTDYGPIGWRRLGKDIDGEVASDQSGGGKGDAVSLISDVTNGIIVAIGSKLNDGTANNSGHARIYQYDVTKTTNVTDQTSPDYGPIGWRRLGQDIDGEAIDDQSGIAVSLSSDGTIIAIGASLNDGLDGDGNIISNSGHVRVFQYSSGTWTKIGSDIDGQVVNEYMGASVALSSDGHNVVIGNNNGGYTSYSRPVRVYNYTPPTPDPTYITGTTTYSYSLDASNNATLTAFTPIDYAGDLPIVDVVLDNYTAENFTLTNIGASAFSNSTALTSITIPASVTDIGASAFSGSTSLADITISGSTIPTVAADAFLNINPTFNVSFNDLTYVKGASVNSVIGNKSTMTTIPTILQTVPMFDTTNVTEFGANAFKDYTSLGAVEIPSFITSIGSAAFSGATSLADITIAGSTIPTVAADSFSNINPTFNVTFDNLKYNKGVTNTSVVGNDILMVGATPTISETVPLFDTTNVTDIGANAFKDYLGITSTIIPASITNIGATAFSGSTSLATIRILGTTIPTSAVDSFTNISPSFDVIFNKIRYNNPTPPECLTTETIVQVIGGYYTFNNSSVYDSTKKYGMGIGTYIFKDVPQSHPMAILNTNISYTGESSNKFTSNVNGISYDFYWGDITVTVSNNFGVSSVYCYYHGYMGGENLLNYSVSCAI